MTNKKRWFVSTDVHCCGALIEAWPGKDGFSPDIFISVWTTSCGKHCVCWRCKWRRVKAAWRGETFEDICLTSLDDAEAFSGALDEAIAWVKEHSEEPKEVIG